MKNILMCCLVVVFFSACGANRDVVPITNNPDFTGGKWEPASSEPWWKRWLYDVVKTEEDT